MEDRRFHVKIEALTKAWGFLNVSITVKAENAFEAQSKALNRFDIDADEVQGIKTVST